jgi:hypothetical protein
MERQTGILAAAMSWPDLLRRLEGLTGKFETQAAGDTTPGPVVAMSTDASVVTVSDIAGKVCLAGVSGALSGCDDPDLITELAVGSGRLVVGCGMDAVHGRRYLVAADRDGLLRCYHHCRDRLSRPFEWGEPLPTESRHPLDGDSPGAGLSEALRYFGFELDRASGEGVRQCLRYHVSTGALFPSSQTGPLGRALAAHYHWFQSQPEVSELAQPDASREPTARTRPVAARRKLKYAVFPFASAGRGKSQAALPAEAGPEARDRPDAGPWWNRQRQRVIEGM